MGMLLWYMWLAGYQTLHPIGWDIFHIMKRHNRKLTFKNATRKKDAPHTQQEKFYTYMCPSRSIYM